MSRLTNDKITIALLSLISCILLGSVLFGSITKDGFFIKHHHNNNNNRNHSNNRNHHNHHNNRNHYKHHTHKILKISKSQ